MAKTIEITLEMDEDIILRGEALARIRGTSLSLILQEYLESLIQDAETEHVVKIDPAIVRIMSLVQPISSSPARTNRQYYHEYYQHVSGID